MSKDDPIGTDGTYSLTRGKSPARAVEPEQPRAEPAVEAIELPPPAREDAEEAAELELLPLSLEPARTPPAEAEAWLPAAEATDPADEGPLLELAPAEPAPSKFERAAPPPDRGLRIIAAPEPEPWWKRRLPHMISAAIVICIAGYCYGCAEVMGNSIAFRRDLPDVGVDLRNMNAAWKVVTPSKVDTVVRKSARDHHLKVNRSTVSAQQLTTLRTRTGGCELANPDALIGKIDPVELMRLTRGHLNCTAPNFLLEVHASVSGRWFLFKDDFDEVAYILINRWAATDEEAAELEANPSLQ